MPKIPINGPLSLSQNIPSVDGRFGPYTSVAEANEYLGPAVSPTDEYDDVISAGLLFGIYEDDGSVTICMWTKDHATVNDFKRISHAQVVQFNGIVTGIVSINQSSGATVKTASDIKYLEQNKKFGYLQGSGYIVNWVNRYIWADASQNPYQDVLYLNIATNALYYYTGTALVALTAGSQGSLVTSVNGQTGAVTITIPTKLSDLTNDVGFITNAGVTSFNGQTGAVTYTPPVTSVNNKTGAVVLSPSDIGLGNVDNTHDANKQVYSAVHDGSGNPIDETYETKTHATAQHSLLQSNIDSLANVAANLTGLEGTNFGGFSLAADAATAVSNIPTVFTQNGCTVGQPYWFLAGADMSALVAYRYIGSGTPAAISATEYDFTDFSGLSERVKDFKGTITTLSAIDDLHNVADVGVYHVKVSQFSGLLIVEKYNDGLNTTITQQLIASGTPVNQGGSYTIESGQTLARRSYSSGAWTSWADPIAELQANVAALGPKTEQIEAESGDATEEIAWTNNAETDTYAKVNSDGVYGKALKYKDGANVKDVKTELEGKMPLMSVDNTPTNGSNNLIKSSGVYDAVKGIAGNITEEEVEVEDGVTVLDDNDKKVVSFHVAEETTDEPSVKFGSDDDTDEYARVSSKGVVAKGFFKQNGTPIGSSIPNIIVVDCNGKGDYTSLADALANAGDTATNHVTILVMQGEYDMPPKVSFVAPYAESNRNLSIKGVNRNKCVLKCNIGFYDYTIGTDCATLRLCGNVVIENLTIISSNEEYSNKIGTTGYETTRTNRKAAYCIHLDQGRREGDVVIVRNCTLINKQMACIGYGTRKNSTIRIEGCYLQSEQALADSDANIYGTIWGHMASDEDVGGQRLEVVNNEIIHKTGQYAVHLAAAGSDLEEMTDLEVSYLLIGNAIKTTNLSNSLHVVGFPEGTCTMDEMSFGNQVSTMNFNNN